MQENVLIITLTQRWFGGALLFVDQYIAENFQGKGIFLLEQHQKNGIDQLVLKDRQTNRTYQFDKTKPALTNLTKHLGITSIFINHLIDFDLPFILNWVENSKLQYEYFMHDYLCLCSNHLLTCFGKFCSTNTTNPFCRIYFRNARLPSVSVEQYRAVFGRFLSRAEHIYSPSTYTAKIVKQFFPDLNIEIKPHRLTLPLKKTFEPKFATRDKLRIIFLGGISPTKGEIQMVAANEFIHSTGLTIELIVLGECRNYAGIKIHGKYDNNRVSELLAQYETAIVATMSTLHETYCYTASEAILSGYPVLAMNVGAHADRIASHDCGWLLPLNSPSHGIEELKQFLQFIVTPEGRQEIISKASNTARFKNGTEFFDGAMPVRELFCLSNVQHLQLSELQRENTQLKTKIASLQKGAEKTLRTWDIFDTLIARRCIFPQRVFELVEQRIGFKGFAQLRLRAEQLIQQIGINYKLNDIYDVLRQISHIEKSIVDNWKQVEIDIEFEQTIPITENINQVKSGDVLISDMYLPEDVIRRMLEKCGLFVPVEIVVTSGDKANGKIYQQFRDQGVYLFHTGDNEQSDIGKPREYKFDSSWTVLSRPTQLEAQLLNVDFEFGAYLRELRLANPFADEVKRAYWSLFVINVGALMLIAKLIDRVQKECGFEYLGFCGRDTYYMRQIYRRLKRDQNEPEPANNYLYYSRKLVQNCEADMGKYISSEIGSRRALMIDLFGTGLHLNRLRMNAKLSYVIMICLFHGYKAAVSVYPNQKQYISSDWLTVDSLNTGGGGDTTQHLPV